MDKQERVFLEMAELAGTITPDEAAALQVERSRWELIGDGIPNADGTRGYLAAPPPLVPDQWNPANQDAALAAFLALYGNVRHPTLPGQEPPENFEVPDGQE